MTQCLKVSQLPDGSLRLEPDVQQDLQLCQYVLQTGAEVGNSLTTLTPAQGTEISMYVMGVWAVAWGFKQVAKTLSMGSENEIESN
ncbi:hypothetical protein [Undibacterium oligocarboniphilum]|uniref:Uncharacterized protein n=1 Tax=Undibacterium oligocarboniphilum TaxID=666702 RepID=A0A850QK32_9BURK|nr:hypothetical protein [Undibacterium oligocarboniphilum]MBC3871919.1 hypothetical protein [Undibacterium oligocarboniphilum]NVO79497.1 hypothetical protein [Undibacterium oligocarboniphilum]